MIKYILSISLILLFAGCTKQPDYTIKHYKDINKDAVLNAGKKVLLLSDKDFNIQSRRNDIDGTHDIAIIHGFDVLIKTSHVKLEAIQEDGITKAKLIITVKKDFNKDEELVKHTTHNLFWDRLEYILALKNKWPSCLENRFKLNFDGVLCDIAYNDNFIPRRGNIIKNISIKKEEVEQEEKIKLIKIDLSVFDNIKLPIVEKEEGIELASIELISVDDLNISEILPIIEVTPEDNLTIISYKVHVEDIKPDLIVNDDENITIISYVVSTQKNKEVIDSNSSFQSRFMNANPSTTYTINLALFLDKVSANIFMKKHKIEKDSFAIRFNKGKEYYKIMYGLYKDFNSAKIALDNLPAKLKSNAPTIEGVGRKQELFRSNNILKSKLFYLEGNLKSIKEINLKTENIKVISE